MGEVVSTIRDLIKFGLFPLSNALSRVAVTWTAIGTTYTAIKVDVTDTASAAGSKLLDLMVGGVSVLSVKAKAGSVSLPTIYMAGDTQAGWYRPAANQWTYAAPSVNVITLAATIVRLGGSIPLGWGSGAGSETAHDTTLFRDGAAGTVAQRNGANAQAFRVYNTYTSAALFERLGVRWAGNVAIIGTEAAGAGVVRPLQIKFTPQTVASLPSAATAGVGARMFVSDALTPTFGSSVTGGGAVNVPVYSDGTNWMVG